MNVVVLGGTRFIGRALVTRLSREGHSILVLTRTPAHAERAGIAKLPGVQIVAGDRTATPVLRATAREASRSARGEAPVVFDFLGMNGADATAAVHAFDGKCRRFVQLSTGAVYWVQEAERCPWIEADDAFPLRDRATCDVGEFDYGVAKRDAEAVYRAAARGSGFPAVLVRAPVVSGPGDWRRRDLYWVRRLLDGRPCILPDGGHNVFNHVYVDDLVELLVRLVRGEEAAPIAPGEALNAADRIFTTLRQYVAWLADVAGVRANLVDVPRTAIAGAGLHDRSFYFADTKSHVLDNRKAERAFGGIFRTPDAWMPPTVAWCRAEAAASDPAEDARLALESRLARG